MLSSDVVIKRVLEPPADMAIADDFVVLQIAAKAISGRQIYLSGPIEETGVLVGTVVGGPGHEEIHGALIKA